MNEQLIVTGRALPISEATKKRNPEMFGGMDGRVCAQGTKRDWGREGENRELVPVKEGISYRISITTFRRRLLDGHDSARQSCKAIVDLVASSLGFKDDSDQRLEWVYFQVRSTGPIGTQIIIEQIE